MPTPNISPDSGGPVPISPLQGGKSRPFWSVMIPTYNCADYLRETLPSVLAQDIGPERMQIEEVDDCSTKDDPEAVGSTAASKQRETAGELKPRN